MIGKKKYTFKSKGKIYRFDSKAQADEKRKKLVLSGSNVSETKKIKVYGGAAEKKKEDKDKKKKKKLKFVEKPLKRKKISASQTISGSRFSF